MTRIRRRTRLFFSKLLINSIIRTRRIGQANITIGRIRSRFSRNKFTNTIQTSRPRSMTLKRIRNRIIRHRTKVVIFNSINSLRHRHLKFKCSNRNRNPFLELFLTMFLFRRTTRYIRQGTNNFNTPAYLNRTFAGLNFRLALRRFITLIRRRDTFTLSILRRTLVNRFIMHPNSNRRKSTRLLNRFPRKERNLTHLRLTTRRHQASLNFSLLMSKFAKRK